MRAIFCEEKKAASAEPRAPEKTLQIRYQELQALRRKIIETERLNRHDEMAPRLS